MQGLLATIFLSAATSHAQLGLRDKTAEEIGKYRQMVAEDNPGELWEAKGAELFRARRGPRNASLEGCDFGLGPGVVKGAFARLPRYFADADKVMDVEARLVHCMVELQGFRKEEITTRRFAFSAADRPSDMEALATYIATQSNGIPIDVRAEHPREKEAYRAGQILFQRRGGPFDFSCATCHSQNDKRIRLQELPNINSAEQIRKVMASWPAYRVSQGTVRTMQHRLADCYWQMRFPEIGYASDAITALHMYLSVSANGGLIDVPAMKR